jgi:methyl-accepting chemotaxis protein
LTERFSEKYLKKLIGRTDIEDALKRLDRLTQEEARMAAAQVLKVTNTVDDRVADVGDGLKEVNEQVKGVKEQVKDIDEQVKDVSDQVKGVNDRVTDVDDKIAVVVDGA